MLLPLVAALMVFTMRFLSVARNAGLLPPEYARKFLHVAMGAMTLFLPWLCADPAPVVLLAGLACVWFEFVRRRTLLRRDYGAVLFGVARTGRGETHFVLGTALTFLMADGSALMFCLPMAILTWADAAAALVGQRFGSRPGAIRLGPKSLAGSSAFFAIALAVSLLALSIAGWNAMPALAVSVLLAGATTVVEAVARNGADNILIPLVAALLLRSLDQDMALPGTIALPIGLALLALIAMGALAIRPMRQAQS